MKKNKQLFYVKDVKWRIYSSIYNLKINLLKKRREFLGMGDNDL